MFSIRRFVLCLLFLSAPMSPLLAQRATPLWPLPNLIKTNLLAPFSLFYERALSQRFALQASVRWLSYSERHPVHFVNAALEARFYLNEPAWLQQQVHCAGLYVSPYVKVRSLTYINEIGYGFNKAGDLDEVIIKSIGYGGGIGYQWVNPKNFTIDAFFGMGSMPAELSSYQHTMRFSHVQSTNGFDYHRLDIRAVVSIGYAL